MSNRLATHPPQARSAVILTVLALGLGASSAHAQNINSGVSIGPSEALSPSNETAPPPAEHLLGDPGGIRSKLARVGVNLTLDWIAEVAGNVSGGTKRASSYAGQIGFEADIDFEKMAGLRGLSFHTVIVNREGTNVGSAFGDNLNQVQEIYGAGGNTAVHLVYAYAEQSFANGRVDLTVGRMPVLNDFAASPLYCNFMNNSLCGNPKSLPGNDVGISSYPDGAWGTRLRVRPTTDSYIQAGLYEVNQGLYTYPNFRSGFKFSSSQDSGVVFPVEVAYEPQIGPDKLPGHYKLGFAYDTTTYNKFLDTEPAFVNGIRGTGKKTEEWALADQMIVRHGPGDADGIVLLAGYTHGDPSLSAYQDQFFAGVLNRDFWAARPLDTIGFLFNYQTVSGQLSREQEFDQAFSRPLFNGATGRQTHQEIIEMNYDIHVTRGVNFEPLFQYYFRPNAQTNIKDAAILGFKSHVTF